MDIPTDRILNFDDFTLNLEAAELRCDGNVVPVEPQVFDLMSHTTLPRR